MKASYTLIVFSLIAAPGIVCGPAQAQEALRAWNSVSKEMRDCVAIAATRSNITLEGIIANGVLPTDPRLSDTMQLCRIFVDGLKTNYACKLRQQNGAVVETICNQYFGVREGTGYRKITKSEAFRGAFTSAWGNIVTVDEEAPEGRTQREAAIRQALNTSSDRNVPPRADDGEAERQAAARSAAELQRREAEKQEVENRQRAPESARVAAEEKRKSDVAESLPSTSPAEAKTTEQAEPGWGSKVMSWLSPSNNAVAQTEKDKSSLAGRAEGKIVSQMVSGVDNGIANFIAIGLSTSLRNPKANGRFYEAAIADAIARDNVKIVQSTDCKFSIEARYSRETLPRQSVKWDGSPDDSAVMRELMQVDFAGADETRTKIVELEKYTRIELSGKWVGYNEKWMITRHEMGDGYAKDGAIMQSPFFNVLQELDVSRLVLYLPNSLGGRSQAIVSLKKIFSRCLG